MKKIICLNFFLLFLLISCSSFSGGVGKYKIEESGNFFWKVHSKTATVYLLGSIHIAKEDMYPLDEKIEDAFDLSDVLVVEINMNDINPMMMMQKAMYSDDRTLKSELSDSTYNQLVTLLEKNKIPKMIYNKMKPWIAVFMAMSLELQSGGYDRNLGIDQHFMEKAKDNKEILELESVEYQLDLFNNDLSQYQEAFVKYSMKDQENMISQIDTLAGYWKNGNTIEIEKLIVEPVDEIPEFKPIMAKLYTERNIRMTERIEGYLKTDKVYFIVVGAAHLIGKDGIVELLSSMKTENN